ncbi:glucose-1-phosphate thymidylyltransferase RfbA [Nonomuraea sp. NPDC049158]|uniref:glucose-1-phosphate thymidylyltransferase RfbA n=1 Tax=Nonomuraea sp. NPDC049158 TaxID=3155649 RepID=UPI0033CB9454
MRGIILAGGRGSRLWPVTLAVSKQLMPIFDKPMIYYPLSTLMLAGIREILVITTPHHRTHFEELLGNGDGLGIELHYKEQPHPDGVAQSLVLGAGFAAQRPVGLIWGDNLFYGDELHRGLPGHTDPQGAHIFAYAVPDPRSFGVVEFDAAGRVRSLAEKPARPRSNYAVPGLYFYDEQAVAIAGDLRPGSTGELEISQVNQVYLDRGQLSVTRLGPDTVWFDTGTFTSMAAAARFVETTRTRRGISVGCVEEIAWRAGYIDDKQLDKHAKAFSRSDYGHYLHALLDGGPERETRGR